MSHGERMVGASRVSAARRVAIFGNQIEVDAALCGALKKVCEVAREPIRSATPGDFGCDNA